MNFQYLILFLFGFIQLNSSCKIVLSPLIQVLESKSQQVNVALGHEVSALQSMLNAQNNAEAEFTNTPNAIDNGIILINLLSDMFNAITSNLQNQCNQPTSQVTGIAISVPSAQLTPYLNIGPQMQSGFSNIDADLKTIRNTITQYIIPLSRNNNGNYIVSEAVWTSTNDALQNMLSTLSQMATTLQNANAQSQNAKQSSDSLSTTLITKAIGTFINALGGILKTISSQVTGVANNLPVTQLAGNQVEINTQYILSKINQMLNQYVPLLKGGNALFGDAIDGLKILQNKYVDDVANVFAGLF